MKNADILSLELSLKKRRNTVLDKIESLAKDREYLIKAKAEENATHQENITLIKKFFELLQVKYDYHHDRPIYTPPVTDEESEVDDKAEALKERMSKLRHDNFCSDLQHTLESIYNNPRLMSEYVIKNYYTPTVNAPCYEDYPFTCMGSDEEATHYKNIYNESMIVLLQNEHDLQILKTKSIGYKKELKHLSANLKLIENIEMSSPTLRFSTSTPRIQSRRLLSPLHTQMSRLGVLNADTEKAKFTK